MSKGVLTGVYYCAVADNIFLFSNHGGVFFVDGTMDVQTLGQVMIGEPGNYVFLGWL
jgi:hypothetical protein